MLTAASFGRMRNRCRSTSPRRPAKWRNAELAEGFGITGRRLDDLGKLPQPADEVMASGDPAVIDVPVSDKVVSPVVRRSHG